MSELAWRGELGWRQADRQGEGDTTQASLRPQPPACCAACAANARRSFCRQANVEPPIIREKLRRDSRSLVSEGRNAAGGVVKKERKERDKGDVWTCLL